MHVETLQLVKMTDFDTQHSSETTSHGMMVDCTISTACTDVSTPSHHAVTSECGVQAASDTVCRGSQITPSTRDAGCQYEETPTLIPQQRTSFPSIIKPSPIKHLSPPMKKEKHSPNTSPTDPNSQNIFLGTKGLHSLNKAQSRSSPLSTDTLIQSHLKQLQTQVLQDSLNRMKTDPLDQLNMRSMGGGEEPNNISSLLQPALMNSLPLTSYALLLDMLNRQAAAGTNASQLASHLNQIQQLSKPTPTSISSSLSAFPMNLNMNSSLVKPTPLTSQSLNTVLSQASPLLKPSLSNSSLLNSTSVSSLLSNSGGLLGRCTSPANLLSSTLNSHPTMLSKSGTSPPNNKRFLIHPPVMMHRDSEHTGKREMDIESLVDSVIDEHMSNNNNISSNYNDHLNYSTQNCVFNRDIMNDYDMAPPFKRRRRTVFTERQLQGLEEAYTKSQYLDRESRLELCKKLGLSLHTVVYWFQNKRAISRRRGQPLEGNNNHSFNAEEYSNFKLNQSPPTSPLTSVNMSTYSPSPPTIKASMVTSMVSPPSSRTGSIASPTTMTGMTATLTTSSMTKTAINTVGAMVGATN